MGKIKKYGLHLQPLYLMRPERAMFFSQVPRICLLLMWTLHLRRDASIISSLLVPFWPVSTVCILKKFFLDLHQSRCGISDCSIRILSFMSCEWGRNWDRRNTWVGLIWRRPQVNKYTCWAYHLSLGFTEWSCTYKLVFQILKEEIRRACRLKNVHTNVIIFIFIPLVQWLNEA